MFPLIDEGQNKAHYQGSMAELAYAAVSKTAAGNGVRVQSPLLLPVRRYNAAQQVFERSNHMAFTP